MSFAKSFVRRTTSSPVRQAFVIDEKELSEKFVIRHQYDPQSTLQNMFSFRGTVVEMVIAKKHFWMLQVKHILLFVGWYYAPMEIKEELHEFWNLRQGYFSSLGSLVVFTIVFYTGNCYTTYKDLFNFGVNVHTNILVLGSHLKASLKNGVDVWSCCRFLLAAQRVFYYDIQTTLAKYNGLKEGDKGWVPWSDWSQKHLVDLKILTAEEAEVVRVFEGERPSLLVSWGETAFIEHARGNPHHEALSAPAQSQYLSRFMLGSEKLQTLLMSTTHAKEFGVPFVYHHIVHITCTFYLILQSFGSLFVASGIEVCYWSLITYPIICFVMLGILCAADAMADPFGEDDCDFNLEALTSQLYLDMHRLCFVGDQQVVSNILRKRHPLLGHDAPASPLGRTSFETDRTNSAGASRTQVQIGGGGLGRAEMKEREEGGQPKAPPTPGSPLLLSGSNTGGSDGFNDPVRKDPRSPKEKTSDHIARTQAQLAFSTAGVWVPTSTAKSPTATAESNGGSWRVAANVDALRDGSVVASSGGVLTEITRFKV